MGNWSCRNTADSCNEPIFEISIRVQIDGQLRTGRDVVIAALLGAEEYGFALHHWCHLGCLMMRKCHVNTCPVGVATQDTKLREKFCGKPEHLMNFMMFVAQDAREIMASLGFRTIDEMVGRVDVLDVNGAINHWKTNGLDFSKVLAAPVVPKDGSLRCTTKQVHDFSLSIDEDLIAKARKAIDTKEPVSIDVPIRNCNRTVGATLSSEVSKVHGGKGLPDKYN